MKDCNQSLEAGKRKRALALGLGKCPDCGGAVWKPGREGRPSELRKKRPRVRQLKCWDLQGRPQRGRSCAVHRNIIMSSE